jgi:hypothetical protein
MLVMTAAANIVPVSYFSLAEDAKRRKEQRRKREVYINKNE